MLVGFHVSNIVIEALPLNAKDDNPAWAGWPLPYTPAGELADIGVFARDCILFGRKFVELAGLRRAEPRALPGQAHASQLRSLEDRTRVWKFNWLKI